MLLKSTPASSGSTECSFVMPGEGDSLSEMRANSQNVGACGLDKIAQAVVPEVSSTYNGAVTQINGQ